MGSPLFRGHVPAQSAQAVLRLKQAGAFVLGKTVTAEMAYLAPGKTRNPWHPAHTPGGSSSGSAAAVAAGFVPAALGTQTNGSVIRPAAYCGVVGYKPSQGMVASTGVLRFSRTLDQVGLFVRSIQDAALLAAALGSRPLDPPAMLERAPRLAAVRSPVWERAEASQREAFANALRILARAGASIDALELGGAALRAHEAHRTIMYAEGAHTLGGLWRERRGSMSRVLSALIEEGLTIGAARYLEALELRAELQSELSLLLRDFDAILTPPATGEAPGTLEHTGDPVFCTLWTLAGLPALTLPIGRGPRGLPLGLQIVGAAGEDAALLGVARWCEQRLPGTGLFPANQEEEG
jgi:Asp-tRNA(Asn)/Glu-tRNA(Gln) amidotransferase A subunit family amidase